MAGNKIPANMRIIEAWQDLEFDKSILTGESKPIKGSSSPESMETNYLGAKCIALQGTYCLTGTVQGEIVSTGDMT